MLLPLDMLLPLALPPSLPHLCWRQLLVFFLNYFPGRFCLPASLVAQMVKHLPVMRETWVRSLGQEDLLEKGMATHSSTLAWKIPWMEEPGRLQSVGSQRVRHDRTTSISFHFLFTPQIPEPDVGTPHSQNLSVVQLFPVELSVSPAMPRGTWAGEDTAPA